MRHIASIAVGAAVAAAALSLAIPAGAALATSAAPGARTAAHGSLLPKITITMNGKKISVSGALRSGGVEIISKVSREAQGNPTLIRLDPGVTLPQVLKAAGGDPNNLALIASVVFSPQANRGTSTAQAYLAPGSYVAADIGGHGGRPPLTTFVIHKSSSPAALPRPQATTASIEFGFRGPGTLRDGELVRFANHGFLVHMMVAAQARSAAGARRIARLLKAGRDNKAGHLAIGQYTFFNLLTHGAYQQEVVRAHPGYWVLACFMNTQDGREHTQLGMERVIRIVK
ncbi:MAG: hypothetical protein ACLPUO_25325 [Streptosporangiaceae bacterium]